MRSFVFAWICCFTTLEKLVVGTSIVESLNMTGTANGVLPTTAKPIDKAQALDDYDEGYSEGRKSAYSEGYQAGLEKSYFRGYSKGKERGQKEGEKHGRNKGEKHGQRDGYWAGFHDGRDKGIELGEKSGYTKGVIAGEAYGYESGLKNSLEQGGELVNLNHTSLDNSSTIFQDMLEKIQIHTDTSALFNQKINIILENLGSNSTLSKTKSTINKSNRSLLHFSA
ncbi:hypothetical protein K493DRAFT_296519 [Basidiobolus meristosporus CBS 931.73]|uniref:Essential protein Yae1 N-terminal domain-containing protein n=1 Tax=Basidiobolus meristosporus CBS 931.73 TaxID=1314790 RepID=A0A1Y1Z4X3_9FUNG|nr:hypothetical protein K493DRAFT_296519 [Basidiobolus meristosporus CBS 931.73]|eukprot:ORY05313.1 hypothetical protein K493DRAFT_296519 [Basidiobolus meristosporus CBS 931.73]